MKSFRRDCTQVQSRDISRKKAGLAGKKRDGRQGPHWDLFRSIQPTVARRFSRGTVWYFCEKSNGISVITFNRVICINVGAPRQHYKLRACKKKSDFVQKAGHFHDLAGRGTSGKKAGLSRQKRDGWQVWVPCPITRQSTISYKHYSNSGCTTPLQ